MWCSDMVCVSASLANFVMCCAWQVIFIFIGRRGNKTGRTVKKNIEDNEFESTHSRVAH